MLGRWATKGARSGRAVKCHRAAVVVVATFKTGRAGQALRAGNEGVGGRASRGFCAPCGFLELLAAVEQSSCENRPSARLAAVRAMNRRSIALIGT